MIRKLVIFIFILESQTAIAKYKPIIFFHGLNDSPTEMNSLAQFIKENHPNTTIYQLDIMHTLLSFAPLWSQVDYYKQRFQGIVKKHPEGVHVIGYSQGGLVARGVIETTNNHNIDTFISIIAPQMGLSGFVDMPFLTKFGILKAIAHNVAYSKLGQYFSVMNTWREEAHFEEYLSSNTFLPYLNNEVIHPCSRRFKRNLIKLNRMVLIGLSDDKVLNPWFTSVFGSRDKNGTKIDMRQQRIYLEDTLGLRTLDNRGAITTITWSGIDHKYLQFSTTFIKTCVLPWLT